MPRLRISNDRNQGGLKILDLHNQTEFIHQRPWDTLIILDACRFDAFELEYRKYLTGDLTKVLSPASCTRDWLRRTWTENYQDITYISANTFMMSKYSKNPNQYEPIHKFKAIIDVWKEGLTPDLVNKYARKISGRKVLHYILPHSPYIGRNKTDGWVGYLSNLEHVLEYIVEILPELSKTIITSDHGEWFMKGEALHPCSKNSAVLREVPWLENPKVR